MPTDLREVNAWLKRCRIQFDGELSLHIHQLHVTWTTDPRSVARESDPHGKWDLFNLVWNHKLKEILCIDLNSGNIFKQCNTADTKGLLHFEARPETCAALWSQTRKLIYAKLLEEKCNYNLLLKQQSMNQVKLSNVRISYFHTFSHLQILRFNRNCVHQRATYVALLSEINSTTTISTVYGKIHITLWNIWVFHKKFKSTINLKHRTQP